MHVWHEHSGYVIENHKKKKERKKIAIVIYQKLPRGKIET